MKFNCMYSEQLGNTFIAEKSMVLMHNINSVKYVMHFYRVFMGVQQKYYTQDA